MRAEELKLNQWYEINGVVGPRFLARISLDSTPSWEFHLSDTGSEKNAKVLVVKDAAIVAKAVAAPPTAGVPEWGTTPSDQKIFGLDGKDKSIVSLAIKAGYRCFDAARTYQLSAQELADACAAEKLSRKDYKVVYKVGHRDTKEPIDDVIAAAVKHLGYIDILMVHEYTDALLANIKAINSWIEKGYARAAGLSNVDSGGLTDKQVAASDLKYMVMLQDSLAEIQLDRKVPGSRARKTLEQAGNTVIDSVYSLHTDKILSFTEEESRKLQALKVDAFQARALWAAQLGFVEVVSSKNQQHMLQNFQPVKVEDSVAKEVVELVNAKILQSGATATSKVWKVPLLEQIHDAAQLNAKGNNLALFVVQLKDKILNDPKVMNMVVAHWPLKLTTNDPKRQRIIGAITWKTLLSSEKIDEQCSQSFVLERIAEFIKDLDEQQID